MEEEVRVEKIYVGTLWVLHRSIGIQLLTGCVNTETIVPVE